MKKILAIVLILLISQISAIAGSGVFNKSAFQGICQAAAAHFSDNDT